MTRIELEDAIFEAADFKLEREDIETFLRDLSRLGYAVVKSDVLQADPTRIGRALDKARQP
jgi:hypothetical protein